MANISTAQRTSNLDVTITPEIAQMAQDNLIEALQSPDARVRWSATTSVLARLSPTLKPLQTGDEAKLTRARTDQISRLEAKILELEQRLAGGVPTTYEAVPALPQPDQAQDVVTPAWASVKGAPFSRVGETRVKDV